MITHVVMFKLTDRSTENVKKAADVLTSMKGKIPFLLQIEAGINVVHSGRSYDIVLLAKFATLEDQDAYQVHPVHQEVQKYMKSVSESVISVDYES